jgi:pimeloyl-ACP methyl ester carboxylesterase
MSRCLVGRNAPESLYASVGAAIRSVKPAVLTARLHQVLTVDARAGLRQVSCPILFIQAQQDHLIGESSLAEIFSIKPEIKITRIEGPHLILQREPEQSAQAVAEFIRGIP